MPLLVSGPYKPDEAALMEQSNTFTVITNSIGFRTNTLFHLRFAKQQKEPAKQYYNSTLKSQLAVVTSSRLTKNQWDNLDGGKQRKAQGRKLLQDQISEDTEQSLKRRGRDPFCTNHRYSQLFPNSEMMIEGLLQFIMLLETKVGLGRTRRNIY